MSRSPPAVIPSFVLTSFKNKLVSFDQPGVELSSRALILSFTNIFNLPTSSSAKSSSLPGNIYGESDVECKRTEMVYSGYLKTEVDPASTRSLQQFLKYYNTIKEHLGWKHTIICIFKGVTCIRCN